MENQPQATKPISDDQELAKVLAGVSQQPDNNFGVEETAESEPKLESGTTSESDPAPNSAPETQTIPNIEYNPPAESSPNDNVDDIATIKKDALLELRPLINMLDLKPEEKFDLYLMLLRSTDDITIIAPAHLVARDIVDESRRAQALLDIIKEIDYLSGPSQPAI